MLYFIIMIFMLLSWLAMLYSFSMIFPAVYFAANTLNYMLHGISTPIHSIFKPAFIN